MSVLINMEMPTSCGDCKAFVCYRQWAGDVGDCFCGITKNDANAKEKNADCPLGPIPPHGRLIDADELAKRIKEEVRNQAEYYADRYAPVVMAYGDCYGKVQSAPTIIPASEEGK